MSYDVIVVGAGPAGLSFAKALADTALKVLVIEKQPESVLADPPFDGREIALTHRSVATLRRLGIWQHVAAEDVAPLRDAKVLNGASLFAMEISHADGGQAELGYLVSNHLLRLAAYRGLADAPQVTLLTGKTVVGIEADETCARLKLDDGSTLEAQLVVAADSRFSETRRAMGIPASMHDFGRTMLVCCMSHDGSHGNAAWEWFDYGQTLAMLPMNGNRASIVVTLPRREIEQLLAQDETAFARDMERRFRRRLGTMRLESTRHAYPLVGVYPERFVAQRFAVVGDAAVGMHPVTAHGFNLGLVGVELLTQGIRSVSVHRRDVGDAAMLSRYQRDLRLATKPLYVATRMIARLYTDETFPARVLRNAALRVGHRFGPFRRAVARSLTAAR